MGTGFLSLCFLSGFSVPFFFFDACIDDDLKKRVI